MILINLIKVDLKRALLSWRFLICACGISCLMLTAGSGIFKSAHSVWYLMDLSLVGSGAASMGLCILPVLPFAIDFANQWEERSVSFWIVRSGVVRYTISKILVSAISGFFTVALGIGLFNLILNHWFILYFTGEASDNSYQVLMAQNHILSGFFCYISHYALSGTLTAVCAMCISVYFPNRFVAASSPVVIWFLLGRILGELNIPLYLKSPYWIELIYNGQSPITTLLIKLATVFVLCCLMCIVATLKMKRRISYV